MATNYDYLTSIHGRRLGLDVNDVLVGAEGLRNKITQATSDTTGTVIPNRGVVSIVTTTNDGWTLQDPDVGSQVTLVTGSSSTGNHAVVPVAATIISSNGIAGSSMTLVGAGAGLTLVGLSTAQWMVTSVQGSSLGGVYTADVSS